MRLYRFLPILLLLPLALLACRGGGDGDDVIDEEARALLEQMVLTAEDLPAGLEQAAAVYSTNRELAESQTSPDWELEKLREWGRRLGYDVSFSVAPGATSDLPIVGVQTAASLYTTTDGALASFQDGVSDARDTDVEAGYPELAEVRVEEVDSEIGDQRYWIRVSGVRVAREPTLLIDDQVAFRVGTTRAFLRVSTVFSDLNDRGAYQEQVQGWAELMVQRIKAATA